MCIKSSERGDSRAMMDGTKRTNTGKERESQVLVGRAAGAHQVVLWAGITWTVDLRSGDRDAFPAFVVYVW